MERIKESSNGKICPGDQTNGLVSKPANTTEGASVQPGKKKVLANGYTQG